MMIVALTLAWHGGVGVDFQSQIRPLLSERCFECHGPDDAARQAGLRLDVHHTWTPAGGIVVPGDAAASLLMHRITAADPADRMPPTDSRHRLTDGEIALIERWIDQGAPYEDHWALRPPSRAPLPEVEDDAWCSDPIDRHVLAGLEAAGYAPHPRVDDTTLLRRMRFDLTGLPPTIAELDALEDTSEDAMVDRLLDTPAYGEHMAVGWLDLARYADTYGYQNDVGRDVWPWRDWVISAFNDNLPWDEFLTWQLAGDLLPDATRDQRLATAFNRLHRQTNEGGSVEEEFRVEYVADRVDTFGTSVLGMTLNCARCHDHKFDPVSQREYWAFAALFDDIDECGLYSHFTNAVPTPALDLPTAAQATAIDALRAEVAAHERALAECRDRRRNAFLDALPEVPLNPSGHFTLDDVETGTVANRVNPDVPGSVSQAPSSIEGVVGRAVLLDGDDGVHFVGVGHITRADPLTLAFWIRVPGPMDRAVVLHRSKSWTDAGSQGYQVMIEDGRATWSLIHFWPGDAISISSIDPIPTGRWVHLAVTYDGSSRAAGLTMHIDGRRADVEVVHDRLTRGITGAVEQLTAGSRFRDKGFAGGGLDEVFVFDRVLSDAEVTALAQGDDASGADLFDRWCATVDPEAVKAHSDLTDARRRLAQERDRVRQIMTMRASSEPRQAYLLERGRYDARGAPVEPGVPPAIAPRMDHCDDRLALAAWVTDPAHPLTARVVVNRLWAQCFGTGLVETSGDFGSQGTPPSNLALLDMLALDFVESGWDVKAMLRRMVTSATYAQGSTWSAVPDLLGAAGPSRRLTAEMLRDQALAASGLLNTDVGGPPAYPPQPMGLWQEKSGKAYPTSSGADRYRRSLYTYWKRTSPPPSMMLFDAAKRDVCVAGRSSTNTPLQALVLMNDEQFMEPARVLAERTLRDGGEDLSGQIEWVFRLVTSRRPDAHERQVLEALYDSQVRLLQDDLPRAQQVAGLGTHPRDEALGDVDVAAMTMVCSTVLNADAAVMRR